MNNNSMNNKKKIPTDGITSDIDLYNLANKIKIKLNGIYFKNELPSPHLGNYIINLASSNDNSGGTHWVHCELRNENNIRKAVYFDPFGLPEATLVTKFLLKWVNNNFNNIIRNTHDIQNINSNYCGEYNILCISYMDTHIEPLTQRLYNFINNFKTYTNKWNNINV